MNIVIVLEVKDPFSGKKQLKSFYFENMDLKNAILELRRQLAYTYTVWNIKAIYLNGYKLKQLNMFSKGVSNE